MYLGIDLGTSNSAIVGNDGRELRLYKTVDGSDVLPSAIMIDRRLNRSAITPAPGPKTTVGRKRATMMSATERLEPVSLKAIV